jgi:hypothetical protein
VIGAHGAPAGQLNCTVMLTDSVTDAESDVHVALKLAVNSLPSNAE